MTAIAAVAGHILAHPAPVLLLDTCTLLDLFRADTQRHQPRAVSAEACAVVRFLELLALRPEAAHLIVPELVPGEFADHADRIEREFRAWLVFHDQNQEWLAEVASCVGSPFAPSTNVQSLGLPTALRQLASNLLSRAVVLDRDPTCLDRAVARLIAKRRPSHKKEMKDSMNLEQCLELCSELQRAGFTPARAFVSSNTNDFADGVPNPRIHPDLQAEFAAVGLEYFTTLSAALGSLRGRSQLP